MSVIVSLNEGAVCPICDRGRLSLVGTNVWDCSRPRCNSQFFFADEGEGKCSLSVRDKPPKPGKPLRFVPAVGRPWNPAYRSTWDAMSRRERQNSFLIDLAIFLVAFSLIAIIT